MNTSPQAAEILQQLTEQTKLGDLRKIAKPIKVNHSLAMELWASEQFMARLLATLLLDKKQLSQSLIDQLDAQAELHTLEQRTQLMDWLMANQLAKDKKTIALMESWENSASVMQRRTFWYHQARLRWVGQTPPDNTAYLLTAIEQRIENEHEAVQWAMNFTAAWIGVFDVNFRARCIALGEKTGLYKGMAVAKGCTPSFLPDFIAIESAKRSS